jgi:hypothetical protein
LIALTAQALERCLSALQPLPPPLPTDALPALADAVSGLRQFLGRVRERRSFNATDVAIAAEIQQELEAVRGAAAMVPVAEEVTAEPEAADTETVPAAEDLRAVGDVAEPVAVEMVEPEAEEAVEQDSVEAVEPVAMKVVEAVAAEALEPEVAEAVEPEVGEALEPVAAEAVERDSVELVEAQRRRWVEPEVEPAIAETTLTPAEPPATV